ncbi:MAG: lysylphosphatidylglycerol synthase transmembrane domain-containing protein [Anaeromyxobacteraceae bacterium]
MKRAVQLAAGISVSVLALWLTVRGKDLGAIWAAARAADYRWLLPYFAVALACYALRIVRWGVLLEPMARVRPARLVAASAVGLMALIVLPFRLGELARPCLVAEGRLRASAALSSIVVEHIVDALSVGLVLVAALLLLPDGTPGVGLLRFSAWVVLAGFSALAAVLAFAWRSRATAVSSLTQLLAPVAPGLAERGAAMLGAFLEGLRLVSSGRRTLLLLLTVAYWATNAWAIALLARGFGFALTPAAAITVVGAIVLGIMIPSGPGMLGTYQAGVVLGLSLFERGEGVAARAVAFANVLWAAQLGFQVVLGVAFLFSREIDLSRIIVRSARDLDADGVRPDPRERSRQ